MTDARARLRLRPGCGNRRQMINTVMRAWELFEGEGFDRHRSTARRPIVSLRHINRLKRMKAAQRIERAERERLWSLMYAQDDIAERELDRREADLDAREQELRLKELGADIEKAIDDTEVDQKGRQRLHQMAMSELRRK
jgi:hypothetical protein